MATLKGIFCHREIVFIFIGITVTTMTGLAQQDVAEKFQKCVTSCIDDKGYAMESGNYPYCDHCMEFVQCDTAGNLFIQKCPLGTNYFNRKLGVCDVNISVCVNDSLHTTPAPTTQVITTSSSTTPVLDTTTAVTTAPTSTSSSTTATTATTPTTATTLTSTTTTPTTTSTTTPTSATTNPTTTSTTTTTTTTTATTTTTTISTTTPTTATTATTSQTMSSPTTILVIQTSTPRVTTTTTSTTTNPTVSTTTSPPVIDTSGYMPRPGREADSFWFAMQLYNNHSLDTTKVGALTVDSLTAEIVNGNGPKGLSGNYYRIYGVTLVRATCPNSPEFSKADYRTCPLMSPAMGKSNQYLVAKCDFKVWNSSAGQLDMVFLMCKK